MDIVWQRRAEQWRRFAAWEADRLRLESFSLERSLAWMAHARDLARRTAPGWDEGRLDLEHVRHLQRVRGRLARMTGRG